MTRCAEVLCLHVAYTHSGRAFVCPAVDTRRCCVPTLICIVLINTQKHTHMYTYTQRRENTRCTFYFSRLFSLPLLLRRLRLLRFALLHLPSDDSVYLVPSSLTLRSALYKSVICEKSAPDYNESSCCSSLEFELENTIRLKAFV